MLRAWYAWSMHNGVPSDWNDNKTHTQTHIHKMSPETQRERSPMLAHTCIIPLPIVHCSLSIPFLSSCLFPARLRSRSYPQNRHLFEERTSNSSTPSPHYLFCLVHLGEGWCVLDCTEQKTGHFVAIAIFTEHFAAMQERTVPRPSTMSFVLLPFPPE